MLIDSHAHLDFHHFGDDLPQVLRRAREAGVCRVLTVGTDLASSLHAVELAEERPGTLSAAAGVHPHDAAKHDPAEWPELEALWSSGRVVAVGETGLDYHYNFSPPAVQRELFARQLDAGARHGLPVIVHLREAFDDGFALLGEAALPAGGVLHCFTGGPAEAERALALGLHLSFAGVVTFPKALALREAAALVPGERLLVETDAPYLAPVPRRGKRNEPAYVAHTARCLAGLRGEPPEALAAATTANATRLFGLPPCQASG
jgi:TatD DNase family protein